MTSSLLSSDANGYVTGFSYHDGFLDGVITDGSDILLGLRSSRDEFRILTLRGIVGLHVEGFREGNIVLNLRLAPTAQAARDADVVRMLAERLFLEPVDLGMDTYVFVLDGSFGADVIAVCGGAEISEPGMRLRPTR